MNQKGMAGLSLLELIVTIAIVTILAGVLIPLIKNALDDAKISRLMAVIDSVKTASKKFWYDTDQLATEDETTGKHDLFADPGIPGWKGPYLDSPLQSSQNPFGASIRLQSTIQGTSPAFDGYSIGETQIQGEGGELVVKDVPENLAFKIDIALDGAKGLSSGTCEYLINVMDHTANLHIFLFQKK